MITLSVVLVANISFKYTQPLMKLKNIIVPVVFFHMFIRILQYAIRWSMTLTSWFLYLSSDDLVLTRAWVSTIILYVSWSPIQIRSRLLAFFVVPTSDNWKKLFCLLERQIVRDFLINFKYHLLIYVILAGKNCFHEKKKCV